MGDTKNTNKKLLIAIFTTLFLIGFIYSIYSQETSTQNNAVSSLESNSIIQEIINSSINGYSTAGQSLASFLSINVIPSYVWTIMIFLMTTLFFIGIYTFLFEIFIEKAGIKEKENETMRKAKILFIFTLSVFSALAIGYAIPFLLNLYGLILLIIVIIALFFFGRAAISYGRSFHYATKSFEEELKRKVKEGELSKEEANQIEKGLETVDKIYTEADNAFKSAEKKFQDILSKLMKPYESFINNLINAYNDYLSNHKNNLLSDQTQALNTLISVLEDYKNKDDQELQNMKNILKNKISNSKNPDMQQIQSIINGIKNFQNRLLNLTEKLIKNSSFQDSVKNDLHNILNNTYQNTLSQYQQISSEIQDAINEYEKARVKLNTLRSYEESLNDNALKVRQLLRVHGDRKGEIAMSFALKELKDDIERIRYLVNERIKFLENLKELLEKPLQKN